MFDLIDPAFKLAIISLAGNLDEKFTLKAQEQPDSYFDDLFEELYMITDAGLQACLEVRKAMKWAAEKLAESEFKINNHKE